MQTFTLQGAIKYGHSLLVTETTEVFFSTLEPRKLKGFHMLQVLQ